jgi:hypothetical protein
MVSARGQRIEANCKIIWGSDSDYDLEIETDDWEFYSCHVRKDFGDSYGAPLTMTSLCPSSEAAWNELDRMLALLAKQDVHGTPTTKNENLEIFGGRKGQFKNTLSRFIDEKELREGKKSG